MTRLTYYIIPDRHGPIGIINNRAYAVGDLLALMAPNDHQTAFIVRVTYILDADQFPEGIRPGYCVLGIED